MRPGFSATVSTNFHGDGFLSAKLQPFAFNFVRRPCMSRQTMVSRAHPTRQETVRQTKSTHRIIEAFPSSGVPFILGKIVILGP